LFSHDHNLHYALPLVKEACGPNPSRQTQYFNPNLPPNPNPTPTPHPPPNHKGWGGPCQPWPLGGGGGGVLATLDHIYRYMDIWTSISGYLVICVNLQIYGDVYPPAHCGPPGCFFLFDILLTPGRNDQLERVGKSDDGAAAKPLPPLRTKKEDDDVPPNPLPPLLCESPPW